LEEPEIPISSEVLEAKAWFRIQREIVRFGMQVRNARITAKENSEKVTLGIGAKD